MDDIIDHYDGRLGTAADAPHPIQGPRMIRGYPTCLDIQLTLKGIQDKLPPHGMTGRAQTGNDMVFAIGDEAKLVVEGGHPIDLGSRDLEMTGHRSQILLGEKPSVVLNCLEDAQK